MKEGKERLEIAMKQEEDGRKDMDLVSGLRTY